MNLTLNLKTPTVNFYSKCTPPWQPRPKESKVQKPDKRNHFKRYLA